MSVGFCLCEAEKRNKGCWEQRLHAWPCFGPGVALPGGKKGDFFFLRITIHFLQYFHQNYVRVHEGIEFNQFVLHATPFWAFWGYIVSFFRHLDLFFLLLLAHV